MGKSPIAIVPKITPHLWFDKEAKEAAAFYCSVFPNSEITHESTIRGVPTPSGDCDIVSFEFGGSAFHGHQCRAVVQVQRSHFLPHFLRNAGRDRLLLGKAF